MTSLSRFRERPREETPSLNPRARAIIQDVLNDRLENIDPAPSPKYLIKFPVQNILVCNKAGGGQVWVIARYRDTETPFRYAQVHAEWQTERRRTPPSEHYPFGRPVCGEASRVTVTDVGTRKINGLAIYQPDADRWSQLAREEKYSFGYDLCGWRYDYEAIIAAIAAIRAVHGAGVSVQWNLRGPKIETMSDLESECTK